MNRFYSISTTDFRPISFGSVYLYGEYNKIKNFLISHNKDNLLKGLAVPSYKNNLIEWSAYSSLDIQKLEKYSKTKQNEILREYNDFLQKFNSFVNGLLSSKNQDNKSWGELLKSLIEGSANELFFDGENIFITWGWGLLDEHSKKLIPVYSPPPSMAENITPVVEEEINEPELIPVIEEYEEVPFEEEEKLSWLDRFYLFLKRIWWLIPMLSAIILILVLLKACENNECDSACVDLDNKLNNINLLLDSCDCREVVVKGCLDSNYKEYNPNATVYDGSCREILDNPCGTITNNGEEIVKSYNHYLGQNPGYVIIDYDMRSIPDKMEVFYNSKRVTSTFEVARNQNGFVGNDISPSQNQVDLCFEYDPSGGPTYCTVKMTATTSGTSWSYEVYCPVKGKCPK